MAYYHRTSGYSSDAVTTGTENYAYLNVGYYDNVVTIDRDTVDYLYLFEGYHNSKLISIEGENLVFFLQLHD
jgi:hypothetical protein